MSVSTLVAFRRARQHAIVCVVGRPWRALHVVSLLFMREFREREGADMGVDEAEPQEFVTSHGAGIRSV